MADELEAELKEKLGGKLEEALEKKISEFGGLLTRRAAVFLLCKENGIETEKKLTLSEAHETSLPFSFSAVVDRIFPVQAYATSQDKSVRLHLSDKTGAATLVLWNEQAGLVEGGISSGDTVECHGAYFKSGEIGIGRNGSIKAVARSLVFSVSKLTHGVCSVEGEVGEVEPDLEYIDKKSGGKKSMSSFQLCDSQGSASREGGETQVGEKSKPGAEARAQEDSIPHGEAAEGRKHGHPSIKHCRRVVVWSYPEGAEKPEEGDLLLLENVLFKNSELHFNSYSRMVKKKSSSLLFGKLEEVEVDGEKASFKISGKVFSLPVEAALPLIGIASVPPGVSPSTLLSIKAGEMTGKKVNYRASEGKLSFLSTSSNKD